MKCIICENDMEINNSPEYTSPTTNITTPAYTSYQCRDNSCKGSGWNYGHNYRVRDNEIISYDYYLERWIQDSNRYHIYGSKEQNVTILQKKNHKYQYDGLMVQTNFIGLDFNKDLKAQAENLLKRLKGLLVFS